MTKAQFALSMFFTAWYTLFGPGLFVRVVSLASFTLLLVAAFISKDIRDKGKHDDELHD